MIDIENELKVYDNLKADKQLVDYCHKDHHDCGQSNPNDTINPCICPFSLIVIKRSV